MIGVDWFVDDQKLQWIYSFGKDHYRQFGPDSWCGKKVVQ